MDESEHIKLKKMTPKIFVLFIYNNFRKSINQPPSWQRENTLMNKIGSFIFHFYYIRSKMEIIEGKLYFMLLFCYKIINNISIFTGKRKSRREG